MSPRRRPPRWTDTDPDDRGPDAGPGGLGATERMTARVLGYDRVEGGPDGREWAVRAVSGQAAVKVYRCPGCDHEIRPGTPHVVAWPAIEHGSIADRRHWHGGCWQARGRRGPLN